MDTSFEQKVRERAYEIWLSAGCADGKAHEHWVMAEQVVANETGAPVAAKQNKTTKQIAAKKPAGAKPAAKKSPAKRVAH